MKVAHKADNQMSKKYPNEGTTTESHENEIQENNYFKGRSVDEIRKKYIQFNVIIEYLNNILELPQDSKFTDLGKRAYELVTYNFDQNESK